MVQPACNSEHWLGPVSGTLHRTYDNDLLVASTRVNQSPATHLSRDADSLLTGLGPMSIIRDEATGFVTSTSVGVVQTHTTYDDYGALATFTATINGTPVLHTAYSRDHTGRINGKVETIEGVTTTYDYSYDLRARLTAVMVDGQVTHLYDYDENGNRTRFEDLAGNHTVHATYSDPAPYPPPRPHRPSTSSPLQHTLADPSGLAAAGERVYRLHAARTSTSPQPRSSP